MGSGLDKGKQVAWVTPKSASPPGKRQYSLLVKSFWSLVPKRELKKKKVESRTV
jgi:hypothetical protein